MSRDRSSHLSYASCSMTLNGLPNLSELQLTYCNGDVLCLSCFVLYYFAIPSKLKKICELKSKGYIFQLFLFNMKI